MELGMSHRGEHSEIESFVGQSVDSELSGNMIDICPVGALTSKPFRYSARTWELSRRKSVSPHDSTGANLIVQVKNHRVMRMVPLENEAVNECWIADRDRFSYEALNTEQRLTQPMIKQGGQWQVTDWQTALEYVANGLRQVREQHGAASIGTLASPHSTAEELYLAAQLTRGLGSQNIDTRLRAADFQHEGRVRWLGTTLAALSNLQSALVIGSNLRKDHPLLAQRLRQSVRKGAVLARLQDRQADWAMPVAHSLIAPASHWVQALADIAAAVAAAKGLAAPVAGNATSTTALAIAQALLSGERKAILLGNAAAHHARASSLLALAQFIAQHTGASYGYLGEAANTVGAQLVGALPGKGGANAAQMAQGGLQAVLLLATEPAYDMAGGERAVQALSQAELVVSLNPFQANLDIADVLLPISPFTETAGTFVNTEGRAQSFHGVVRPLGETRPGWKVLRVLGHMMGLSGFDQETIEEVRQAALPTDIAACLSNETQAAIDLASVEHQPVVASIYQLDGIVRRAPSLQLTADARGA
jgi:NADH-quinone oxidoreductase subunit G